MSIKYYYFLVLLVISSCSNMDFKQESNTNGVPETAEEAIVKSYKEEQVELINEDGAIKDIIGDKLQEIYDLIDLLADTSLPTDMRLEADAMLDKLLLKDTDLDATKNKQVTEVAILSIDSLASKYNVSYQVANQTKQAAVDVNISKAVIENQTVANYEVVVESIE